MGLSAIGLIVTLAFSLLVGPRATDAQQPVKIPRLGLLLRGSPPSEAEQQRSAFLAQLRELGWHEGHTIAIEDRYAEGRVERLPALAAELVRLPVDVIVTFGTPATQAAKQATSTIPIIMTGVGGNPVDTGLVASLARPGGTSRGWPASAQSYGGNDWSSSRRPFPGSLAWLSSGIRRIQAMQSP